MSEATDTPAVDPAAAYEAKTARLKVMASRMQEIIDASESTDAETFDALTAEREELNQELTRFLNEPCGAARVMANGGQVVCSRQTAHPDDHFDEIAGWGWANENDEIAVPAIDPKLKAILDDMWLLMPANRNHEAAPLFRSLNEQLDELRGELARTHAILDRVGVPRDRMENTLKLQHRANLFVDRLSKRLHGQVENNMELYNAIRDALTSLVGSPNSGNIRIRSAIERLRAVLPSKKSTGGLHLP